MKIFRRYLIVGIIDLVALAAFAYYREIFKLLDGVHVYHILSDDFFIVGVLNLSIGVLLWVGNSGGLDMLNYGMRSFWGLFFKGLNKYADYQDYKESKRGSNLPCLHFVIYGALFIVLAYVFLKLYQIS